MVHYPDTNEKVWELCQKESIELPTIKIGDKVRLKKNWLDIFIDIMKLHYFPDKDRSSNVLRPSPETIEHFKGGDSCVITSKFIALNMSTSVKNLWWSGTWKLHGKNEPDYFFDQCFEPIVTNMYTPKKFVYESFNEFNKQIK